MFFSLAHFCANPAILLKIRSVLYAFLGIYLNLTYPQHSKNINKALFLISQKNSVCFAVFSQVT